MCLCAPLQSAGKERSDILGVYNLRDGRWLVTVPKLIGGKSKYLASFGSREAAEAAAKKYYPRVQSARATGRTLEAVSAARAEIFAEVGITEPMLA